MNVRCSSIRILVRGPSGIGTDCYVCRSTLKTTLPACGTKWLSRRRGSPRPSR
jgi:hypothetical protein